MSVQKLNAYLFFNGNAAEVIEHYVRVLDAKLPGNPMRFGEAPGMSVPPEVASRIMHATLQFGETTIMISDTAPDQPVVPGGSVHLVAHFTDVEDMTRRFDALAVGGKVDMALHDSFWSSRFGSLVDKFGVHWMFNCEKQR